MTVPWCKKKSNFTLKTAENECLFSAVSLCSYVGVYHSLHSSSSACLLRGGLVSQLFFQTVVSHLPLTRRFNAFKKSPPAASEQFMLQNRPGNSGNFSSHFAADMTDMTGFHSDGRPEGKTELEREQCLLFFVVLGLFNRSLDDSNMIAEITLPVHGCKSLENLFDDFCCAYSLFNKKTLFFYCNTNYFAAVLLIRYNYNSTFLNSFLFPCVSHTAGFP